MATYEVAKRFMEDILFMKTPWPNIPMTSTGWLKKLGNYRLKPRIVSGHEKAHL
jgi:hypothetical protein